MSVQNALKFIQKAGEEKLLKDRIQAVGSDADLKEIVEIGSEAGFEFTVEELRAAFTKDWAMRRFFYSNRNSD